MKTEAEWGAGQGQPRDAKTASSHWELEEAWRLSLRVSRRNQFCQHLDFGLLASTIVERYICVRSHPTCSDLLWQPWETNYLAA